MLDTSGAAKALGVSRVRVHQLITSKRLRASKFGNVYMISRADLVAVRVRKPGRPRSVKPKGNK